MQQSASKRPTHTPVTSENSIRDSIVEYLLGADQSVSGELLSHEFGITRAAVWKHIHALEEMGFQFHRRHGVGYRIERTPDLLLGHLLRQRLHPSVRLGEHVIWKKETTSTNDDAVALLNAKMGVPDGTIVTALSQSGGRGRHGRRWSSPEGGLWQSIVITKPVPLQRASSLTLVTSVAVRRALEKHTQLPISIKWPNDLLCGGKKLGGILAEVKAQGETTSYAVIGIGLNTNVDASEFPKEIQATSTSVWSESGRRINHLDFEADLLKELDPMISNVAVGGAGFSLVSDEWKHASATLGQLVRVSLGDRIIEGRAVELDDDGTLHVDTGQGVIKVLSGDILF